MTLVNKSKLLYQLKLANQELVSRFEKSTGFSITRYEMLLFINAQGPCSQTQLQQELGIDRAAVTRHLKRLQDLSYVTRKRNDLNNREVYVQITDFAQKELANCEQHHESLEKDLYFGLSDEEEVQLLTLLNKITK